MSKRAYISRYLLIIKKLKQNPYSTKKDMEEYLVMQSERLQMEDENFKMATSDRTISRDIKDMRALFGIDIEYSRKQKGYFINQGVMDSMNFQRMIESFDMFSSLKLAQDLTPFIHLERRRPLGTENLYGLLHAIKNRLQIKFSYQKFWEDEKSYRKANPYAMKEFKDRWYLIAKDSKDGNIKSFALDRLTDLEITNKTIESPRDYNIEEVYRYCFGIISPNDEVPQEIVLSFDPVQGRYIKSLPLHETQEVLIDNDDEIRIRLKLCLTYDFLMELISHGDNVKVLKPATPTWTTVAAYQCLSFECARNCRETGKSKSRRASESEA